MTKGRKSYWAWGGIFSAIFLLSQDYLFARWGFNTGPLGFPVWLWWFVLVHILFLIAFYWFSKKYWKE